MMQSSSPLFGGAALIAGGTALASAEFLITVVSRPVAGGSITAWVKAAAMALAVADELLFVALVCLVLGGLVLWQAVRAQRPISALVMVTSLLLAMAVVIVLVLVVGRLVYPVYDIAIGESGNALLVSLMFGGLHAVSLLLGIAVLAATAALRGSGAPWWLVVVGTVAAIAQWVGAFPWLTPDWVNGAVPVLLGTWMLAAGVWLIAHPHLLMPLSPSPRKPLPAQR